MKRGTLILLLGLVVGVATHHLSLALHHPYDPGTLDGQLAWMKSELRLSDAQFNRIRELHQASSPRLRSLASQVAQMQVEFVAFENTRRTSDKVDFIEFAQFVEVRRNISRQCLDSTRSLVMAAASEMNPAQREHYFGIVAAAEPQARPLTN
jgi:hypothetical protein